MRKHGGAPSWRDQHVTPAAISPPGVASKKKCFSNALRHTLVVLGMH